MSPTCPVCGCIDDLTRRALCGICDGVLLEVARAAGIPVDSVHGRRFMTYVNMAGVAPPHAPELGPCWLWTGAITSEGYGLFRVDGRTLASVHTLAYRWVFGAIPEGMEIDHMCCARPHCTGGKCAHRACWNPSHMRLATHTENTLRGNGPTAVNARKTHCVADPPHPLSGDNLYIHPKRGTRHCRACAARRVAEASQRAAVATIRASKTRALNGQVATDVSTRAAQDAGAAARR